MFRSYLKTCWRNMMKNKTFSFINIFGLAIGFTCCIFISIYIHSEFSYDNYHDNGKRIFQLGAIFISPDKEERKSNTSAPVGSTMQREFPEIQEQARLASLFQDDKTLLQYKSDAGASKSFYETKGYAADSSFFKILTYHFLEGDAAKALIEPNTVVIADEIAYKLFGKETAINKTIRISSSTNGDHDCRITGVFKPSKIPSHINARFILSMKGGSMDEFANSDPSMIYNNMFFTYFLLKEGTDVKKLESKFPSFVERHMGKDLRAVGLNRQHFLIPVNDIHLRSDIPENVTPAGNTTSLFVLGSIALLTLLIACINFMNLSTSSSAKRASEVGVRKVLGAQKAALLKQFLGESLLLAVIAMVFAVGLTHLLLPLFEQVSGKALSLSFTQHKSLWAGFCLLAIITGLLAGTYPAFYLSSFKPIQVLKGKFSNSLAAVSLRKGLVVVQFVISIALIVASVVIANQMKYMRSKDLGFIKDQQVVIPLRTVNAKRVSPTLKNEIKRNPGIQSVGASTYYPGIFNSMDWLLYKEGETLAASKQVYINIIDNNFLQTLGIKLLAGRLFSEQFPGDTNRHMIINEEAVKNYGFSNPQQAVGKWLAFDWDGVQVRHHIIGVVQNFHFKDLHEPIQPYGFELNSRNDYNYLIAHVAQGKMGNALQSLEQTWKKINPDEPFEYSFIDQDFQKNYEVEIRQAQLINYFTIIAIIISCLGLFGLATFSAEQRIKEIGIRKVLGASVMGLVALLTKDFMKLIAIAVVIAIPLGWFIMYKWLQNFAYRTIISWEVFALTTLLAVLIALVTISFQAVKAAIAKPVKNLRME